MPTPRKSRESAAKREARPGDLGDDGSRIWDDLRPRLGDRDAADLELLTQYARLHDDLARARAVVEAEGAIAYSDKGSPYQHPAVGQINKALDNIRKHYAVLRSMVGAGRIGPLKV